MKRGFTLLELLIVIIIVGVMATLGLTQYSAVVERSRGAEARQILGQMRSICAALYMNDNDNRGCITVNRTNLGLNTTIGEIPLAPTCLASHYFTYNAVGVGTTAVDFVATRCAVGTGKNPGVTGGARTLTLNANYQTGATTWTSPNGY